MNGETTFAMRPSSRVLSCRRLPLAAAICAAFLITGSAHGATLRVSAAFTTDCGPVQESGSTGGAWFGLETPGCVTTPGASCDFSYAIWWANLSDVATLAQLRGVEPDGCAAGAQVESLGYTATVSGYAGGSKTLDHASSLSLIGGELAAEVLVGAEAELQGQLTKEPDGSSAGLVASTRFEIACAAANPGGGGTAQFSLLDDSCLYTSDGGVSCVIDYEISWGGLSAPATGAHLHPALGNGCPDTGVTVWTFFGDQRGEYGEDNGQMVLAQDETVALFKLDSLMVDLHTLADPDGGLQGRPREGALAEIPAASQWGLIGMALLLLTAGTIALVRRRQMGVQL